MKNSATLDFRYAQESFDDESASDSKDIFDCLVHGNKPFPHVGISTSIQLSPLQVRIFNLSIVDFLLCKYT
jgi:hypothetical protein